MNRRKAFVTIYANTPQDYAFPVMIIATACATDQAVQRQIQRLRGDCRAWDFFAFSRISDHQTLGRHTK